MKFFLKPLLLIIFILSLKANSAITTYSVETDEFTDDSSHRLVMVDDSMENAWGIDCTNGSPLFMIYDSGYFVSGNTLNIKIRFDSDKMMEETLDIYDTGSFINRDTSFINTFLSKAKSSNKIIIKAGNGDTITFTGYNNFGTELKKYVRATNNSNACKVDI